MAKTITKFKLTEIGEIPADWSIRSIGALCSRRKEQIIPTNTGINRYVGLEHLDPGFSIIRRWGNEIGLRSAKNKFKLGDVLYGKLRPYLDKSAVAEWGGVCSTDILVLSPLKNECVPEYLGFLLHTGDFLGHAKSTTKGVNHPRTSWDDIKRFSCCVPQKLEQERIAGVLSKIQKVVENQEKIVSDLRELKAATIAKLFREGLRGEPLKQTEIGEIPQSWEVIPASKFCVHITDGTHDTPKPSAEGHFLITSKNLRDGIVDFSGAYKISVADYLEINKRSAVDKYDVIFGMIGTVGAPVIVSENAPKFAIKNVGLFKTGDKNKSIWLINYFESPVAQRLIKAQLTGATQKYVPLWFLREFPLIVPTDMAILNEISGVLEQINRRISLGEQKLTQYRVLFSSTLNQLMTGKVRIKE
jgi:type I restriction enzyme S subunit